MNYRLTLNVDGIQGSLQEKIGDFFVLEAPCFPCTKFIGEKMWVELPNTIVLPSSL